MLVKFLPFSTVLVVNFLLPSRRREVPTQKKEILARSKQGFDPPKNKDREDKVRPHPQYGWDFPEGIPEEFFPGNALRAFPGILVESTAGMPQTL